MVRISFHKRMENNKFILLKPTVFPSNLLVCSQLAFRIQPAMGIYQRNEQLSNGKPTFTMFGSRFPPRIEWVNGRDGNMWAVLRHGCGPFDRAKIDEQLITSCKDLAGTFNGFHNIEAVALNGKRSLIKFKLSVNISDDALESEPLSSVIKTLSTQVIHHECHGACLDAELHKIEKNKQISKN